MSIINYINLIILEIITIGDCMKISKSIQQNLNYIKELNNNSSDIVTRTIKRGGKKVGYIYLESVSSDDKISNFLNKSIDFNLSFTNLFSKLKNDIFNSHIDTCDNYEDIFYYLSSGYTVLFIEKYDNAIVIETKSTLDRGVVASTSEPIIRGPKDSFTENHAINIGLIRKRIKDPNLFFEEVKVGRRTKTKVDVVYIDDIADKSKAKNIINEIKKIDIDGILDSGYIREFLEKKSSSVFPKVISTERPDVVCASLLDGKIAILVENTPYAIIMPGLFIDFIHSPEDNYYKPVNATFSRFLRLVCFFCAIITPALYVALMTFNPEIIPDQLLISFAVQRDGVPFPTAIEVLIFVIIFEILMQADIHSPTVSGSAMNIVGALILGDAAVNAGIVSPIVIIIIAITSISELVFYDVDMINAVRQWRILFILSSLILGLIGFVSMLLIFLNKLASIECIGVPYLTPVSPTSTVGLKNSLLRLKRSKLTKRQSYLSKNTTRMVKNEKNNISS